MIKYRYLLSLLLFTVSLEAAPAPSAILKRVYQKLMSVKDYTADAHIRSDIPLIRIMPVQAKVYFKQKDKFKLESKGIALLPRQGLSGMTALLRDSNAYMAVASGSEMIGKHKAVIISLLPLSDTGDLILAKIWVDTTRYLALKTLISSRSSGSMGTDYFYGTEATKYGLPDSMVFTVDVKKFKIPKAIAADLNKTGSRNAEKDDKKDKKGKIYVRFRNYKINKGIPDSVFKK